MLAKNIAVHIFGIKLIFIGKNFTKSCCLQCGASTKQLVFRVAKKVLSIVNHDIQRIGNHNNDRFPGILGDGSHDIFHDGNIPAGKRQAVHRLAGQYTGTGSDDNHIGILTFLIGSGMDVNIWPGRIG
ncbi:hypothetical protein SDC9_196797 [bioreactor metagenome]|uniref:Uncharacterized protein n=1 Tax=bioreactor metagenome TaxID=1076179 RepID=A0A645IEB6_9ZZZZ